MIDQPEEASKPKRKKSVSAVQRTLAECRRRGWTAAVVERWNPHARIRQDLFGIVDVLALTDEIHGVLGIQVCGGDGDLAKHRRKIAAAPHTRAWFESGAALQIWSWRKVGAKGRRKLWDLLVEVVRIEDVTTMPSESFWSQPRGALTAHVFTGTYSHPLCRRPIRAEGASAEGSVKRCRFCERMLREGRTEPIAHGLYVKIRDRQPQEST